MDPGDRRRARRPQPAFPLQPLVKPSRDGERARVLTAGATELTGETAPAHRLAVTHDPDALAVLEEEFFGKRILVTDHDDWPVEQVIDAYRSQEDLEAGFRQAGDPHVVSFSPIHQYTDRKIRIHLFTCVLGLALAHLMRREAEHAGLHLSVPVLLRELAGSARPCCSTRASAVAPPGPRHMITRVSPRQRALHGLFDLERYVPPQ